MTSTDKLERWMPLATGLVFAIPVLLVRYPPMTDLALHEAVVTVLRHFSDPKYFPPGLYQYNLGHPNQLFYLVAWPLAYAFETTWAMKIVVAGTLVGLFVAAATFARHMGTPRWTALLVGVLGLGWLFYWGLVANLLGMAVFLAIIPALDRFVAKPTARGAFGAFGLLLLLYSAHETLMLCACLMIGVFALGYPLRARAFFLRLAPAVAMFVVALLEIWWLQSLRAPYNREIPTIFVNVLQKFDTISGVLFAGYEPIVRAMMVLIALIAVVPFAILRWKQRPAIRGTPLRELLVRYRFEIYAAMLFAAYLLLPMTLNGATLFYHRFFPPAYAILVVVLAPRGPPTRAWRVPILACIAAPIGSLAVAWPSFVDAHEMGKDVDALIEMTEYRTACLIVDVGADPARLFTPATLEGHAMARRGGRSLFDFTRSPIAPAFMSLKYAWEDPWARMHDQPILVRPSHDLDYFRYVYFHSAVPTQHLVARLAFAPDAVVLGQRGEWTLFESTHLKHGLLDADAHLPYPRPHTLRRRMRDVYRKTLGQPIPKEEPQAPPPGWTGPRLTLPSEDDQASPDEASDAGAATPDAPVD